MDGMESKTKMLAKIAAMKEELARKKKKLRKSQRVAKIKAHVQLKLKEFNVKDGDQKHHFGVCENSVVCDDKSCKESPKSVASDKTHSSRSEYTVKQNGLDSGRAKKMEKNGDILSKNRMKTHVIPQKSLLCEVIFSEKKVESDIESRIQNENRAFIFAHEDHVNESSLEAFSPKGSIQHQSSCHLDNGKKFPFMKMNDKTSSQLGGGLSEDALHFESQLISSASQSENRKEEFLNHSNKHDHNLSNSQFIEILGLSQPINLTPVEKDKQEEKKKGHKFALSLKHRREPLNETLTCDPLDADSQSIPLGSQSGTMHLPASVDAKSSFHSHKETNSTYEYTELDAISFSQFELTEDFLSENSCLSQQQSESTEVHRKLKRSNCKPLIKRKSPRISAMSYSSDSMSLDATGISEHRMPERFYKASAGKRCRLEEKTAAVLSAFQFLIDEAKRQGKKEFHLPHSFQPLMEECKEKWNLLSDEVLKKENEDKSFQICYKTAGLFKSQEIQNYIVQNEDIQSSGYDKPYGVKEINTSKNNDEVSYHNQNEASKGCCNFSQSHDTENKNVSGHHKPHSQLQDFESQARVDSRHKPHSLSQKYESQAKCVNSHYEPYSQSQDTEGEINCANRISQCPSSQCNEKHATDSPLPIDNENSNEETNSSFTPSFLGLKTPRSSAKVKRISPNSGCCVRLKSIKAAKEITDSVNCNPSVTSFLCSQDVRDKNVLNSADGIRSASDIDNNNASSNNGSCFLLREENQSSSFSSSNPKSYYFQKNINSPQTSESCKISLSCHKPPSSSTPISGVKSRFKSFDQKVTPMQLSNNTDRSTCIGEHDSHTVVNPNTIQDVHKEFVEVLNAIELDDSLQSAQNVLKVDVSICNGEDGETACASPLLASPISKWPEGYFSPRHILPWKKISRTPYTPLRILEGENSASSCRNLNSPTFSHGDLSKRNSLPRPIKHGGDLKDKGAALYFAGCFQCCSEDSVVQLLHCEVNTELNGGNDMKVYLVSVQASALTIWAQDVDGQGWIPELDWRLSSNIHILEACSLAHVSNKIAIAAYGWEENELFATVFVYDVCSDITNRFNLPIVEENMNFKNLNKLHFCCMPSCHLLIGISSTAFHTIRSVVFDKSIHNMVSTRLFEFHRGTLIELQACADLSNACFGLTSDQKIVVWNTEIGAVLKSIQMPSAFPCLTSLLAVASVKGFLLLTVSWRIEKSDCGGTILLNPVTEQASSHRVYKIPNSGWKGLQNVSLMKNCVVAISSSGSVSWWNHLTGALLGHRKSHSATCATVMGAKSILIGEVQGCVHIYSTPAS